MPERKGRIEIRKDRCKSCSLCISVCPRGAIVISRELNDMGYRPAEFNGGACTACGLCYTVCPEPGCVTVFLQEKEDER